MIEREMELYGLTTLKALKTNDWESNFPVFEKLERDGLREASLALGQHLSASDEKAALEHFKKGADEGCSECAWGIAAILGHEYIPSIISDDHEWFKYCNKAARGACADAMNELGNVCHRRGEILGMFYWYEKAAFYEHPDGSSSVSGVLDDWIAMGRPDVEPFVFGLTKEESVRAKIAFEIFTNQRKISPDLVKELMPAILVGEDDFLPLVLGGLFEQLEIDDGMAKTYYQVAANNNSPTGMRRLADMLAYGKGCEQDKEKAIYWFAGAAAAGDRAAQFVLGQLMKEKEPNLAAYWYMAAHRRGYAQAMPMLMELCP